MNATPAQSIDEWLLAEHRRIREITDRFDTAAGLPELLAVLAEARPTLAARAQACLAGPMAQIFGDARSLAQRIRKHEVAEDQIVADSLYGDLGQGD